MQFKHILVALLVLLALVGTAAAADSVEIRSTIIEFDDGNEPWEIDAYNWAGLYYNLNDDTETELLTIDINGTTGTNIDITYETEPNFQPFEYKWVNGSDTVGYAIIGFFAEPYVAVGPKNLTSTGTGFKANKIAKLIADNDDKYTLKTGATLELGSGFSLVVDQIDVDGNKAYIKLMNDGKEINSSIVTTDGSKSGDWILDMTLLNEKNIEVFRVHVKDVFQGTESSLVEIEGYWLIDYPNAFEVKSDVDYGKFEAKNIGTSKLEYLAEDIALSADLSTDLGKNITLKTEKEFDGTTGTDKFYLVKEYTEPGVYEIRSDIFDYTTAPVVPFTYKNFAAFFYDIDENIYTEEMNYTLTGTQINEGDLIYVTEPQQIAYAADSWVATGTHKYYVMGLFGEKYVPLTVVNTDGTLSSGADMKPEKMAKLTIDNDDKYTLKTGATLELGDGYSLIIDQIDVDGNKAYIKFFKDGKEVNSSIITTSGSDGGDWILRATVLNEKNIQTLRVHVKDVFQGTQDSLVEIEGLWVMDYVNAKELKTDDKFGILEYDGIIASGPIKGDKALQFKSESDVTLQEDMDKQIANNMYLKTADDATTSKYGYFYVNAEVGEGSAPVDPQPPVDPSEPTTPTEPPVVTPTEPDVPDQPDDKEPGWFSQNWKLVVGILVLIIIIAGAAYYFMVYKKQA
ncbi:MAG: S-layer protein domain-containing protein [Methanimicrococcus sp.]|nr:S-layer protein domain-containing protein [Methanimicrococcus sp.]